MALELTPIEATQLSPIVARVIGPNIPGPMKMMAARGLAPMGPRDLVTVIYQLTHDGDVKIAEAARGTAESLPDNILSAALGDALDPRILHFFSPLVIDRPSIIEKILLNRQTHDETLIFLGTNLGEEKLEILAANQERLLKCPAVIEAIYFNRNARMSTVDRLLEMAVRNGLNLDRIPQFKEISASILGGEVAAEETVDSATLDEVFQAVMQEGWDQGPIGEMELEEIEEQEETKKATPISNLPIMAKIRLATIGTAMHRGILIKDANKLVSMAAIKSQAVSEQEAARYAANRSLHEEIIRYIATRKEWHKNYTLKTNLVNNPKCPLMYSIRFLSHLRPTELRNLVRSKNIPSAVAKAAKEELRKRGG